MNYSIGSWHEFPFLSNKYLGPWGFEIEREFIVTHWDSISSYYYSKGDLLFDKPENLYNSKYRISYSNSKHPGAYNILIKSFWDLGGRLLFF